MAIHFRSSCTSCEYQSDPISAGGLGIFVTSFEDDERRQFGESPAVVILPFERYILDEFGLSFYSAAWGGQLVELSPMVCRDCGQLSERRRLSAGGVAIGCAGCLGIAITSLTLAVLVAIVVGNPFIGAAVGAGGGVLVSAMIEFGASRIVRYRYANRVNAIDTPPECPHCESLRCVKIESGVGALPCPDCQQRTLVIVPFATS